MFKKKSLKQVRLLASKRNIKKSFKKSSSPVLSNNSCLYSTKKKTERTNNFKKPSIYEQGAIKTGLNNPNGETINVNSSFDHLYA